MTIMGNNTGDLTVSQYALTKEACANCIIRQTHVGLMRLKDRYGGPQGRVHRCVCGGSSLVYSGRASFELLCVGTW